MDLSGRVVKRLPVPECLTCLCSHLDLVGVASKYGSCSVIDPATGVASHLLDAPSTELDRDYEWWELDKYKEFRYRHNGFALGRVESTGEYKVLRISSSASMLSNEWRDTTSVLTVNGFSCTPWISASSLKLSLPVDVDWVKNAVVGGSVYFLESDIWLTEVDLELMSWGGLVDDIAVFSLETEQWATTLMGTSLI